MMKRIAIIVSCNPAVCANKFNTSKINDWTSNGSSLEKCFSDFLDVCV